MEITIRVDIRLGGSAEPSRGGFAAIATLREWRRRCRSRQALEELDPAALRDIGISRGEALHEASKPFWRA